jgi:hypothetical protein
MIPVMFAEPVGFDRDALAQTLLTDGASTP